MSDKSPLDLQFKWYPGLDGGGSPGGAIIPQLGSGKAGGGTGAGVGFFTAPLFTIAKEVRIPAVVAGANYSVNLFDFSFMAGDSWLVKGYGGSLLIHDIYLLQGKDTTLENDYSSSPLTPSGAANAVIRIRHDNPGGRGGEPATTDLCAYTTTDARINGIAHKWSAGMTHILPAPIQYDVDAGTNEIPRTISFRIENTHGSTTITTGVFHVILLCGVL